MKPKYLFIYFLITINLLGCTPKVSQLLEIPNQDHIQYESTIRAYREKSEKDFILYNSDKPAFSANSFLEKLDYFPVNVSYKCECQLVLDAQKQLVEMTTYAGTTKLYNKFGVANCKLQNTEIILTLYKQVGGLPIYQNLLFLPIKDMTSGAETYGGGRYLNLDLNEISNNKIIIDFNRAYNPWCAYSGGFTCPIPPLENNIMMEIYAGEKDYAKH